MRAAVAILSVLVLALAATGGEARAGDGRHLLGDHEPKGCKNSNCYDFLKKDCDWLPKSHDICSTGKKVSVPVKNCFAKKCGYVSISAGGQCYKYNTWGKDIITTLDLKCGDKITIFAWDKYLLKGDGSTPCTGDNSRDAGHDHCKTCHYEAEYKCKARYQPGDVCRKAYGKCDVEEKFDDDCVCPPDSVRNSTYMCRDSYGLCDAGAKCDGRSKICPASTYAPDTTVCRNSTGPCDSAAKCYHGKCPENSFKDKTVLCRPAKGPCDMAEYCTGHDSDCPDDEYAPHHTLCRNSTGPCDAPAYCKKGYCPKNEFLRGKKCRGARGVCERDAYCNGYGAECPKCELRKKDTKCRKAYGECDVPEFCDGKDYNCPKDEFAPNTTECRKSAGPCDAAEFCTGYNKTCPPDYCGERKKLEGPYCPYTKY